MVGQVIGRYRLIRQLGGGGMGMVFEAVREDIGGRAAVKVLRAELAKDTEIATRFFNEARATNLIEHPGIVRIFDYGCLDNGVAYLAMEFLEGESLRALLKRSGRLPIADALRLGRQMASALAAAHAKKVIHRDLKPVNVMLVADADTDGGVRVKILDFGIAKLIEMQGGSGHTRTDAVMGTPTYMSPEQCRGARLVGEKSDVYSLGVMLFEMLCGTPPFSSAGTGELLTLHMFEPPPPLETRLANAPPRLCSLMAMLLAKDPAVRPTMAQVAGELQRLSGLPPTLSIETNVINIDGGRTLLSAPGEYAIDTQIPASKDPAQATISSLFAKNFELRSKHRRPPRRPAWLIGGGVLALALSATAALKLSVPSEASRLAAAERRLTAASDHIKGQRWSQALAGAQALTDQPDLPLELRLRALDMQTLAEREQRAQDTYQRFLAASRSSEPGDLELAVKRYREIPKDSFYVEQGREDYERALQRFVAYHLDRSETARQGFDCSGWKAALQKILDLEPKQALDALSRGCTDPPSTRVKVSSKSRGEKRDLVSDFDTSRKSEAIAKTAEPAPEEVAQTLEKAQTEFKNGNLRKAIEVARSVHRYNPARAWRIIGGAACHLRDVKLANESYRRLDPPGRQYIVYACQHDGLVNSGNQFRLAE